MKRSRVALALLALAAITLPLTISAIGSAAKPPKPPKYKVLVVTAGDRKTDLNLAVVKALREIGGDNGTKAPQNASFVVDLAQNADQINDRFTAKQLAKYRAVIFADTGPSDLLTNTQKQAFETIPYGGAGLIAAYPRSSAEGIDKAVSRALKATADDQSVAVANQLPGGDAPGVTEQNGNFKYVIKGT